MSRFQFVADHRRAFEVKRLCKIVGVVRSSFYTWLGAAPTRAARAAADAQLADRIRTIHEADRTQGAPRIAAELNDGATPDRRVNRKRVARVMRAHAMAGLRLRRRVRTTIPEPAAQQVPDLLRRDFTAPAPNQRYVGDITYLPIADGSNLYLATVIDCFSRRLAGWAIAEHMRTDLVTDALTAAHGTRGSLAGAIFHSDHGAQYSAKAFAQLCERFGVTQSMGAVGTGADNALAESFNASLKRETLQGAHAWPDYATCQRAVFGWVTRYNTRRRHSYCGQSALGLVSRALTHLAAGERSAAQGDLRHAQQLWPAHAGADLAVLRAVAEQFGAGPTGPTASAIADTDQMPGQPELEALARLSRGHTHLQHDDHAGARAEFDAALALSHRHGFDYLTMQCLTLLGVVAARCGELRTMRTVSDQALAIGADRGWPGSPWSPAAAAMAGYGDLLQHLPADAERRTADALATLPALSAAVPATATSSPASRFALHAVHGAAMFDLGDRAAGLAELQQARSDFGANQTSPHHCAAMAMLEFRVALQLGHAAAARTVLGWLTERIGDSTDDNAEDNADNAGNAELVAMRAWTAAAAGHHEHARTLIRPVLDGSTPALLPHTVVEGWLLQTSIAAAADERPAARHALQTALALAEPLDALRPFAQAGPHVGKLLIHLRGSFGASEQFAHRVPATSTGQQRQTAMLSAREITVLALLPSMLSLEEIALDLTVMVSSMGGRAPVFG